MSPKVKMYAHKVESTSQKDLQLEDVLSVVLHEGKVEQCGFVPFAEYLCAYVNLKPASKNFTSKFDFKYPKLRTKTIY